MSVYAGMGTRQVRLGVTEKTKRRGDVGVRLHRRQEVCCVVREQDEG